jgi:hypothetical protein
VKILRSFPDGALPVGRGYIHDGLERFLQPAFDYTGLKRYDDDVIVLEWDIAVSAADIARFREDVGGHDWPVVAPFLNREGTHFMHWRDPGGGRALRPIVHGEADCDLFGFGMVYLPAALIRDYPGGFGGSSILSDGSFPRWLETLPQWRPVPVDWSITVVHVS